MGNCVFKGFGEVEEMIKVVTSSGGIMELYAPVTAESITNEFPGHAIYRTRDFLSQPLAHNEELHAGQLYYLLPLNKNFTTTSTRSQNNNQTNRSASVSSSSVPASLYRMSVDSQKVLNLKRSADAEVLPRYNSNSSGVWKVKLVISPEQLAEILAQEARTEALIESVRTVAKCANTVSSSLANSDQWSVSSSTWKGTCSCERPGVDI